MSRPEGTALLAPEGTALTEAPAPLERTVAIAAAVHARASVEARYLMAMQRPRNWLDVAQRLNAAMRRPGVAAVAEYSVPRGDRKIVGPSIRFAEEALRAAGNVYTEVVVVDDTDTHRTMRVTMTDLESNWSIARDVQVAKTLERSTAKEKDTVLGQRLNSEGRLVYIIAATEEELLFKQNSLISRVVRTDGLRLLPSDLKDDALAVAAEVRRDRDAKDPAGNAKVMASKFYALGVTVAELEKHLGKPLTAVQPVDVEMLRALYTGLHDGEFTWDELRERAEETGRPSGVAGLREKLAKKAPEPAAAKPEAPLDSLRGDAP